ncbi:MAG: putative toxin-antitoxin system toxin component, PIN family [Anaerolineae bacterium]|nr:putative toxin-antitoxin system toxin component, PIN family [Anaerolineae bacterium]
MQVVVDTSVLIRYLIRPSTAIKGLIECLWVGEEIQMVTSPEIIAELEGVLARDYIQELIHPEEGQALLEAIHLRVEITPPLSDIPSYTRDPKDDKFIACALAGNAKYVITVDKDILILGTLMDIHMVTPDEFRRIMRHEKK